MPETTPLVDLIAQLAARDASVRQTAGAELFRRGCAAAEPVLKRWIADTQFRSLLPSGPRLLTVGIAVTPDRFEEIRRRSGEPHLADVPPGVDVREFELNFAHGVRLDILTPLDAGGGGAVARFLARFGEGIQQVECEVRDVSAATERIRSGFALDPVYSEPHPGAGGTRINFFLASAAAGGKVLIELVEPLAKKKK